MHDLNADLHCHSTASDGTLAPEALVARAVANGVDLWALTDHDDLSGIAAARAAARSAGLPFVAGVEISVSFAHETVHIVGLGIDEHDAGLRDGLAYTRSGRERRARTMAEGLAQVGIRDAYEGALRYVGNPELISRTHFARYLVEAGVCGSMHEVFSRYLVDGKPGYVPMQWARLADALRWIHSAGGVAVIAHPGRYKFTPTEEMALFEEFKQLGGEAVEVITGSHTSADFAKYADWALRLGLMASRGSDFHSPDESLCDLGQWGRLPALPEQLTPVWSRLMVQASHV
ncbi:MAG: PHP domain-containing protein [Betaproteobacteria bacterium]|nr:PHP domain-containing protein [Betaproteobacteria bacterium]